MLPGKSRSKLHALCSIVLVCLCVTVLLVLFAVRESTSVVTETAAAEELRQTDPGTGVRRDLTAGAKEVFAVSAGQGTLLRFSIDKGDLALTTIVYGPTSVELLEHVSEEFEFVELSVPADVAGTYRIEIQSREKVDTPRPYELKVDSLIPITPAGRKDSEARQAMATAGVLRAEWTEASLRQAREAYDKAAVIWTSLRNFSSASQASLRAGDVYFRLSEYAEALRRYQNAATLAVKTDDRLAEAKALSLMGRLYSYTGKNDLAEDNLTKALHLLSPVEANTNPIVKNAYGEALSNLAEVIYAKGNMIKSSEHFQKALELLRGDRKAEAKVHIFTAYIAGSIGLPDKAVQEISEALDLYQATNDDSGEGLALTVQGVFHSFKGNQEQAIELDNKAIGISQRTGDRHSEAIALNALGQAYEKLNNHSTALAQYQKALTIFHDTGAVDLEAVTIFLVAKIHGLMKHFDQALELYERGLKLSRSAGKLRTEANALGEIALVYAKQDRREDALQQYRKLLRFYENIDDRRGQALALNLQGDFLLRIGRNTEAAESFQRALTLTEETGAVITTLYNLARAERTLGHLDEALSFINRSLRIVEDLRKSVGSPELRASYFSGVRQNYDECIQILMDLNRTRPGNGFAAEALFMSEKSRARLLLDLIREAGADLRKGTPKELISREQELGGLIQR